MERAGYAPDLFRWSCGERGHQKQKQRTLYASDPSTEVLISPPVVWHVLKHSEPKDVLKMLKQRVKKNASKETSCLQRDGLPAKGSPALAYHKTY